MKKLLIFILILSLLTFMGCNNTDSKLSDNQSDITSDYFVSHYEMVSSEDEILSSNESENVSSVDSSDITSSQPNEVVSTSSAETVTSSQTESTIPPIVSNAETSSTPTQAPTQPTTFFEKYNLSLTPINNNLCFSDEPNHTCPYDKIIAVNEESAETSIVDEYYFDEEFFDSSCNASTYKVVEYSINTVETWDFRTCNMTEVIIFDKYTGTILAGTKSSVGNHNSWQEITINDKKMYISNDTMRGLGPGGCYVGICCPVDYDGAVFAVLKNKEYPHTDVYEGNITTIDQIIDFENDIYYLFAAEN